MEEDEDLNYMCDICIRNMDEDSNYMCDVRIRNMLRGEGR